MSTMSMHEDAILKYQRMSKSLRLATLLRDQYVAGSVDLYALEYILNVIGMPIYFNNVRSEQQLRRGEVPPRSHTCWNVFTNLNLQQLAQVEQLLTGQ